MSGSADLAFIRATSALNYPGSSLGRLQSAMRRMAPIVAASVQPTFTKLADGAVSDIVGAVFVPLTDPRINLVNGSRINVAQTGGLNDGVQRPYYSDGFNANTIAGYGAASLDFSFNWDGQVLELVTFQVGNFTLFVNGQYAGQIANASIAGRYIEKITFASAGPKVLRFIGAGTTPGFFVGPTDTVQRVGSNNDATVLTVTDSYGQRVDLLNVSSTRSMAIALGIPNCLVDAFGGTGYQQNNTTVPAGYQPNNYVTRLGQLPAGLTPDMVVVLGGINDTSAANVTSVIGPYYQQLRALYPNAVVVAVGPWCPNGANATVASGSKWPAIRDAIKAGVAAAGGPWVFIDNLAGTWTNSAGATGPAGGGQWQTGSLLLTNTGGGGTTSGSTALTLTSSAGVVAGALIVGPNIPAGTTVASISGTTVTMSQAATATASAQTVSFYTASGNALNYLSNDGTHPSPAGITTFFNYYLPQAIHDAVMALGPGGVLN